MKRGKTDAVDAAALCEAVTRPSMRFVAIKSEACSSVLVLQRTRDFLVRQRTQIGNAIRSHMTEFGIIAAKGAQNVDRLKEQLDRLPEVARMPVSLLFDQLAETNKRIERLTDEIAETSSRTTNGRYRQPFCCRWRRTFKLTLAKSRRATTTAFCRHFPKH